MTVPENRRMLRQRRLRMTTAPSLLHSAGAAESVSIIPVIEAVYAHSAAPAGCMDEFTVADVDSYVRDAPAGGVEEDEVAFLHRARLYLLAVAELAGRRVGGAYSLLPIDVAGEAGAM